MGILEERLNVLGGRMMFFREVEGPNGGFKVFGIKLALCLGNESGERVGV